MSRLRTEYVIEAACLGAFMISACVVGTLLGHPSSRFVALFPQPWMQRVVGGVLMGMTAIVLIYSPWGKRSGAHMNPAFTLTFLRLGKVAPRDALAYVIAQFIGGVLGVLVARALIGPMLGEPPVSYVVTEPGSAGPVAAFAGEATISAILMTVVLRANSSPRWSRFTGVIAGILIAAFIAIESPFSGMSMNPARTLASAVVADRWMSIWIYFTAPVAGMLLAAHAHIRRPASDGFCAKLAHASPCLFCEYTAR